MNSWDFPPAITEAWYRRGPGTGHAPVSRRRRPWKSSVSVGNSTCDAVTAARSRRLPGTKHRLDHQRCRAPYCSVQ